MGLLDKKFNIVNALHIFLDKTGTFGSTTMNASVVKGASTFVLASATNFAIGDDIRVGTGETMELVRISGLASTTVTPAKPLKYDHAAGEPIVEQEAYNFGVPEADGVRVRYNGEQIDVFSAVSRLAFGTINGFVDFGASWRWPFLTTDALAIALGIPRANTIGDGTAAAQTGTAGPRMFTTDGGLFSTLQNANAVMTGVMNDGSYFKLDLYNITFDPTAVSVNVARGSLTTVPARVLASGGAADFTNSVFTPQNVVQTYAGSKADMPREISDVSTLTASGTATTTTAGISAGAYVIPCTSVTGIVAGDVVALGSGDNREYHIVHAVATLNLNLRTQVLRAHSSGVAVVKQTITNLGVAQGGATLAFTGSVETQRSELSRMSLAYRAQNIAAALTLNVDAVKPESMYLALGIASTEYANSVLPINNNMMSATEQSMIFRGLTAGGKTFTLVAWNGALQVNGETQFTQAATALFPIGVKPNGLSWLVNA